MYKSIEDLDTAIWVFTVHERGVNDYLRDFYYKINPQDPDQSLKSPHFDWYWSTIYKKLKDDGILYEQGNSILWTVEGRLFAESVPKRFKNRPYAYKRYKERLNEYWQITKVVANILNALAILWLAWKQINQ